MEIKEDAYRVAYDEVTNTLVCEGVLRLNGDEYDSIEALLNHIVYAGIEAVTLDFRGLRFLNSAGINIVFHFIFNLHEQATEQIVILGDKDVSWHRRSLMNLKKLIPELQLVIE